MEMTIRNCLLVALILLVATLPISNQMSIRRSRTRRQLAFTDLFAQDKRSGTTRSVNRESAQAINDIMVGACRDIDVFNLCYACGRDIRDVRIFNNCCDQSSADTFNFCISWLS